MTSIYRFLLALALAGLATPAPAQVLFGPLAAHGGTMDGVAVTGGTLSGIASAVIGAPTGGNKGAGTLNATGLYVNGTAVGAGGCAANCTFTGSTATAGIVDSGGINTTATSGYSIGGVSVMRMSNAARVQSMMFGPGTGASLPVGSQFTTGFGANVYESFTAAAGEGAAFGSGVGIEATTGSILSFGTSSCAAVTTQGCFAYGLDARRDSSDALNLSLAIGNFAEEDGSWSGANYAIGSNVLRGAASTFLVAGAVPTVGDVYTFPVSTTNLCNGTTVTINCTIGGTITNAFTTSPTYTVVSSDTTSAALAAHIATALTGMGIDYVLGDGVRQSVVSVVNMSFQIVDAANHPTVIWGHYPASWLVVLASPTCVGTCGATVTYGPGFTGSNNLIVGNNLFQNPLLTNPQFNTIISLGGPQNFVTSNSSNTFFGYGIAPNLQTGGNGGGSNTAFGTDAGASITTAARQVLFGYYAGFGITTGTGNHVFADQFLAAQNCITSGSNNLEAGEGACIVSPTLNQQMSIVNAIWGANNSGTGATQSAGQLAFEELPFGAMAATELGGEVIVGLGSALATAGTANFFHYPFVAAAPTGTPANIYGNACVINTASQNLNCYIGAGWFHVAMTSGAL